MSSSIPLLNDDDCSMTGFDSQAHPSFSLSDIKTEIKTENNKTEVSFIILFSSFIIIFMLFLLSRKIINKKNV